METAVSEKNGLATAGMVLGIIALAIVWIPVLGLAALPLALVGTPLAGVGFARSKRSGAGRGTAIAGLVLGIVALIMFFVIMGAWGAALSS